MFKTFWEELKYIGRSKWHIASFFVMLFIPFIYGFLYMNAYWAPFKHVDKLPIILVNADKGNAYDLKSKTLEDKIFGKDGGKKKIKLGSEIYDIKLQKKDMTEKKAEELVNSGKYSAAIVIPKGYSQEIHDVEQQLLTLLPGAVLTNHVDLKKIGDKLNAIKDEHKIQFYNSYKHNYLAGEMTNFGVGLAKLAFDTAIAEVTTNPIVKGLLSGFKHQSNPNQPNAPNTIDNLKNFIHYNKIGGNVNSYGFGLSPYFISIALWAGALVMTFVIKNERRVKTINAMRHYFGKTLVWLLAGFIQTSILMTAVTLQGVHAQTWEDEVRLFMWAYFVSSIFILVIQAVSYSIRYGDIGEFAVVILLVIQLISSSGTFPVEMQNVVFKALHSFIPFTYSINGVREILSHPDIWIVLRNMGILFVFPIILVPISLLINHRFDIRTRKYHEGIVQYESYEIHMGDM